MNNLYVAAEAARLAGKAPVTALAATGYLIYGSVVLPIFLLVVWPRDLFIWGFEVARRRPFDFMLTIQTLTFTPIPGFENVGNRDKVARAKARRHLALTLRKHDRRDVVEFAWIEKVGAWFEKASKR